MIVVNVPEPAIKGNAIGTTVTARTSFSLLKSSKPKTISKPKIKITIDPPTANDLTSSPDKFKKCSPMYRKRTMNAGNKCGPQFIMPPNLFFNETNMGIDPMISITAKRVKLTVRSSLKFISMLRFVQNYRFINSRYVVLYSNEKSCLNT